MNKEKGFILIFALCITTIVSLLVLSSMKNLMIYQHAATIREREHQRFYQLERITRQLIHLPKKQLRSCTQEHDKANYSIIQLVEQQGCQLSIQETNYWYLVEDLGIYPCLITVNAKSLTGSHHFRVTVLTPETEEYSASLVQVRVIETAKSQLCTGTINYVRQGISSWRYLTNIEMNAHQLESY
jgi:type II secretory pathway component PulJ